ncbi:MAG: hypothetical protein ETSY1_02405 [Candidatus Entotheonella factor]|uniref:DUF1844 domain-containing protein n=1 Tax=Entotheonella factor TaxID=1429438 RepID=W4LY25_ENTF1|nr:DUF1844 domain-containing protein [Candidatus Entotheonella palauensis]ETX02778.1 MAG: hypothetical protein ETSY1_02405 [Candidatus Entotheonella factor]
MTPQDREEEQQEQGFTVSDKRLFTKDGARREGSARPEPSRPEPPPPPPPPRAAEPPRPESPSSGAGMPPEGDVPPADFSTYVIMLANTVMMMLGQVPDPVTQQRRLDLTQAKHTIDILMMLQEKTRGNLDAEEIKLIDDVMPQLQMAYVSISRQAGAV